MFRFIRHTPALSKDKHVPVAMHANYHTDKANKMKRVYQYYAEGQGPSTHSHICIRSTRRLRRIKMRVFKRW